MRKILLALLLLGLPAWATTTVSGNLKDLSGSAVSGNTFVRFWLRGCAGNNPRVNGTAMIAPNGGAVWYKDFAPNSSGAISGTIYSTRDAAGTGAGEIECGGSFTAVWYGVQAWNNGRAGPEFAVHAKNGATIDISNVTPITTNPVTTAPTGDTTYARLDSGNQPFTGAIQATNATFTGLTSTNSGVFNNLQTNEYVQSILNGCSPSTEFGLGQGGNFTTDAVAGCLSIPATATQFTATAIAGYLNNSSTTTVGVTGYFFGRSLANLARVNVLNGILQDSASFSVQGYALDLGVNFLNTGSTGGAILIEGASTHQSLAGTAFGAIAFSSAGTGVKWKTLLHQLRGASPYILNLDDAVPEALNVDIGSTGNRYFTIFDGGDSDSGDFGLQVGFDVTGTRHVFFQSRNSVGANNIAYAIVLNPLGGNVGVNNANPNVALDVTGTARATAYATVSNCSSSASPAICSSAPSGSVVIAASATTVQVNTTAVTANSQIMLTEDSSLGTKLSVTCNTTLGRTYAVTARSAGTSFTITTSAAPVTNPACLSYLVIN